MLQWKTLERGRRLGPFLHPLSFVPFLSRRGQLSKVRPSIHGFMTAMPLGPGSDGPTFHDLVLTFEVQAHRMPLS
jgi:hypothetical protein